MNPQLPERLSRGALVLRRWEPGDAEDLSAAVSANLDRLRPYMPWVAVEPVSVPDRRALIRSWHERYAAGTDATMGIWLEGEVAGSCGLHGRIGPGGLEIGYWVAQAVARRRVAATAAALLTTAALHLDGIDRVEIHHAKENLPSEGVARILGYTRVGEVLGEPTVPGLSGVEVIWRMTAKELDSARLDRIRVTPER